MIKTLDDAVELLGGTEFMGDDAPPRSMKTRTGTTCLSLITMIGR